MINPEQGLESGRAKRSIVEQNDRMLRSDRIDHRRVPIVHRAAEALAENEWRPGGRPKRPISVPKTVTFHESGRRGVMCHRLALDEVNLNERYK